MIRFKFNAIVVGGVVAAMALSIPLLSVPVQPRAQEAAADGADGASPEFKAWVEAVYQEGLQRGIGKATLDAALTGLVPLQRVVQLDRKQPEFVQTFDQYIAARVTDWRVQTGRARLAENSALLEKIGSAYGVQPRFIVALWGVETSFGRATGSFSVVQALATLAFDGRRGEYFRRELFNALEIIDAGHVTADAMKGSWAGAMGQNQFMPSSFLNFAVDFDGDGRRDIWGTRADVFASTANYLRQSGWRADQTWGRRVQVPPALAARFKELLPPDPPRGCTALRHLSVEKPLPEWARLGVTNPDGSPIPQRDIPASLVMPEGPEGPALLVYNNFRVTLRWNCSVSFAASVGILADRLQGL